MTATSEPLPHEPVSFSYGNYDDEPNLKTGELHQWVSLEEVQRWAFQDDGTRAKECHVLLGNGSLVVVRDKS